MKKLIIKGNIPNISNCTVNNFEEEYCNYLRNTHNNKWRTPEAFSLDFDSTLEDLKKSKFVYVDDLNVELALKKHLNVIEEVEL